MFSEKLGFIASSSKYEKEYEISKVLSAWLTLHQNGKSVFSWFMGQGIKTILVYGAGILLLNCAKIQI